MAWHAVHIEDVVDHRADILAGSLGVDRAQAFGHIVFIWVWAQHFKADGNLAAVRDDTLKAAAQWKGDAQLLRKGLIDSGYADAGGVLVDWEERLKYWRAFQRKAKNGSSRQQAKRDRDSDTQLPFESPASPDSPPTQQAQTAQTAHPEEQQGINLVTPHIPTNQPTNKQTNHARAKSEFLPGFQPLRDVSVGGSSKEKTGGLVFVDGTLGKILENDMTWVALSRVVMRAWAGLQGNAENIDPARLCEALRRKCPGRAPSDIHLQRLIASVLTARQKENPIGYVLSCRLEPTDKELEAAKRFLAG